MAVGLLLESDDVATAYKVSGIPTFYIIDQDGSIALTAVGLSTESRVKIDATIEKLLTDEG